jgi:dTDP-4-amino-4,6-dideoxygalactose transaminase
MVDIPSVKPFFASKDIERVKKYVEEILKSGMLTLGKYTQLFEKEFARVCDVKYAVAVSSGTSALEIVLRSFGVNGGEILVPTNTFTATAASVFFAGGKPVLTDINPKTLCIDVDNVHKNITNKTKGIIVVHIGGLVCPDIKAIREICEDRKLFLIEDAAHAHGCSIDGEPAGSLGNAGCFSFYPTKVITTGEGGIITTNDNKIAEKALILRDQGKEGLNSNTIIELGYNWRMDEISAAIGLVQLKRLPEIIKKRNKLASLYDKELSKIPGIKPVKTPKNIVNNYYKYVTLLDEGINRNTLKQKLREYGIKCGGEVYWPPLHQQPIYKKLLGKELKNKNFEVADDVCKRMTCLPIYYEMNEKDVYYVCQKLREVLFII